jgi:hypothetical protein
MIAIPQRKIWTPWERPAPRRPSLRDRRSWWRRLIDPLALYANGDGLLDGTGADMLDASGNEMIDGGSQTCCLYQARDCATGALQSLYVKKSQFPSFPSTYFFKLSGTCYYVQTSDKVACSNTPNVSGATSYASCAACTGGGGGGAPCACAWPAGLSATYTVSGFGSLGTCPDCDPDTTDPAWDGTLNHIGGGCVWWAADSSFDPLSINGAMLDITYTQVVLNTTACRWELYIACGSVINPTQTMWSGYKTTGSTPAGTYSFVSSDCGNTTPTMTVA